MSHTIALPTVDFRQNPPPPATPTPDDETDVVVMTGSGWCAQTEGRPSVILVMTPEEASFLRRLVGSVVGPPDGPRRHSTAVSEALKCGGIERAEAGPSAPPWGSTRGSRLSLYFEEVSA